MLGVGEKVDDIEEFHPERLAGRILGMGDVVSLVERAAETIEAEEAEKIAERMMRGVFTLDDMASQLKQARKPGGLGGIMGMLPGVGKLQEQRGGANIDDRVQKRHEAVITDRKRGGKGKRGAARVDTGGGSRKKKKQ